MRWTPGGVSDDVEDRRDDSGGGGRRMGGRAGIGCGGFVILLLLSLIFKKNFFALLGVGSDVTPPTGAVATQPRHERSAQEERLVQLVSFVLDDVQSTWAREFQGLKRPYQKAKLVLFTDTIDSACGYAQSAMGPFYCPEDHKVYIDLGFYQELQDRFGAPGEFAEAYVIAHEMGHNVQYLLGIDERVRRAQAANPSYANEYSVGLELQADCLAGVWGHSTQQRKILEAGDVESGLGAAAAVGDDRIQRQATGHVNPEKWTHGSSKQRVAWFKAGFESGDIERCATFGRGKLAP
jgi:predicted metalloprotease